MSITILAGDALQRLQGMPDASVHCVVTSPPYYGLRDYGVDGQMGLEASPQEFLTNMVAVFREVRRVLRDDGTCWVNMGDSYASAGGAGKQGKTGEMSTRTVSQYRGKHIPRGEGRWGGGNNPALGAIKPKDLMGMPWRLAFALQDDGWYLRQDIIWAKPNPMPESVADRCTKSHEYVFLLSKSPRYYYDAYAIREPLADKTLTTFGTVREPNGAGELVKSNNYAKAVPVRKPKQWKMPDGWDTGDGAHGSFHREGREKGKTNNGVGWGYANDEKPRTKTSGNKKRKPGTERGCPEGNSSNVCGSIPWEGTGANKRSVWTVATQPFKEAHFATFPPALIEPCILAGCPKGGTVLDPFFGAGTTGLVADRLQRHCIGIELNPAYIEIAHRRIAEEQGMFSSIKVLEQTA